MKEVIENGIGKIRILFVDDETNILDGLRRMLRCMKHEWDMEFVENGLEALKLIEQEPFDVVVSDMLMPGMDGFELLTQVKQRYPMIVRIIFSGYLEREMILKSIKLAHQYLSKPCAAETLISKVKQSFELHDHLEWETLETGYIRDQ